MHTTPPSRHGARQSARHRRLAALGVAFAVVALPLVGTATAANAAADTFAVTSPTEGQTDVPEAFPKTAVIAGEGLTAGNHVDVKYVTGDGTEQSAVFTDTTGEGDWEVVANFDQLGLGQTAVEATVSELTPDDELVVSIPLTFSLAVAPNPADPFTVATPGVGEVVETATPEFSGTATPGTTVVILYGARSGSTAEAGVTTVGDDGTWAVETDFSRLEPGSLGTGADVFNYDAEGEPIPGITPIGVFFTFAEAPVPLIPLTLTVDPGSSTVTAVGTTGVALAATGFSPNEQLMIAIALPDGSALPVAEDAPLVFANDEDGSYAGVVTVSAAVVGDYTVTITGVRSERTVSSSFAVVADPVPTPPTPGPTPGGGGSNGGGDNGGGGGSLANTGFDAMGGLGIGAMLLVLGGAAAIMVRRRRVKA
jgi:LPXTG-motif cell wall-anchored protein